MRSVTGKLLGPLVPVVALPNPAVAPSGSRGDGRLPVVVAAGRLNRQKGFDLLIRAWVRVHRAHPTWTLQIYGEGPRRPRLAKMIESRGLASSVRLEGFTPDLQAAPGRGRRLRPLLAVRGPSRWC